MARYDIKCSDCKKIVTFYLDESKHVDTTKIKCEFCDTYTMDLQSFDSEDKDLEFATLKALQSQLNRMEQKIDSWLEDADEDFDDLN